MTPEQIQKAKARAEEVVDGFRSPKNQNARDALNLAKALQQLHKTNDALYKRLNDLEENKTENFDDIFKDFFKKT